MKIIAFYLPQFHEVEENNLWWGEGFTEWTNVKSAKPLFVNHNQPVVPLYGYYNVLEENTLKWQADLAKKYGVYGFCYYHYWFEGRKILERPAEKLLGDKTIEMNYCFCWANHSWKKTWNGTMELLIEQNYGQEKEWDDHFNYLKAFFEDDRYIMIDNKPILMLFKPDEILQLDERIKYYNEKCKKIGYDGIYVIESINIKGDNAKSNFSDGVILREPSISLVENTFKYKINWRFNLLFKKLGFKKIQVYNFDKIVKKSLKIAKNFTSEKKIFFGAFTGWDSTPRHKNNGYVISGYNKNKFINYLKGLQELMNKKQVSEFVFLNAWNEWAEGMFLEPDVTNKYEKLEAIAEVVQIK